MKKFYSLFQVEEWRKKYGDSTDTHLKSWDHNYGADRISGDIVLTTPDAETPEKGGQLFLVTIEPMLVSWPVLEPIDQEKLQGKNTYESSMAFFKALRDKDANANSGISTGRKFR